MTRFDDRKVRRDHLCLYGASVDIQRNHEMVLQTPFDRHGGSADACAIYLRSLVITMSISVVPASVISAA